MGQSLMNGLLAKGKNLIFHKGQERSYHIFPQQTGNTYKRTHTQISGFLLFSNTIQKKNRQSAFPD